MCSCVQLISMLSAKRFLDERRAFDGKVDAEDEPLAAHLADEVEARGQFFEPCAELRASVAHVGEQVVLVHDRQEFQGGRASQRPSAERGAMHPRRKRRCELFVRDECA